MTRNSGLAFKKMVAGQLEDAAVGFQERYLCGFKPGTNKVFSADFYLPAENGIICCIYQDTNGSMWEKHAYKYMCANRAILESKLDSATIVLFNLAEDSPLLKIEKLRDILAINPKIKVLTHEEFTKRLIRNELFAFQK